MQRQAALTPLSLSAVHEETSDIKWSLWVGPTLLPRQPLVCVVE